MVIGVAAAAMASGFGQFGVVAALGDVARTFGQVTHGATLTDQAGLSGTELGVGLAVIRLSSIGALPLAGLADRFGRRSMLLMTVVVGLVATVVAAASPGYWWFVVVFALGRPFLSATNALSQVMAAEQTGSGERTRAVALVTAGYGVGAGLTAVIHSLASSALGFRGVFALAVVPLLAVPFIARRVTEPDRFAVAAAGRDHPMPVLGAVGPRFRNRLLVVAGLSFAVAVITGPANTFIFLYAENVRHLAGGLTAAMVVAAGVTGLGGLLVGRWLADRLGRRPTGALGMVGIAVFGCLAYSGTSVALVVGYVARGPVGRGAGTGRRSAGQRALPDRRAGLGGGLVAGGRRAGRGRRAGGLRRGGRSRQPVLLGRAGALPARVTGRCPVLVCARDEGARARGPMARWLNVP